MAGDPHFVAERGPRHELLRLADVGAVGAVRARYDLTEDEMGA